MEILRRHLRDADQSDNSTTAHDNEERDQNLLVVFELRNVRERQHKNTYRNDDRVANEPCRKFYIGRDQTVQNPK